MGKQNPSETQSESRTVHTIFKKRLTMGRKKKNPIPELMDGELEPSPNELDSADILTGYDILDLDDDDDLTHEDMFPEIGY